MLKNDIADSDSDRIIIVHNHLLKRMRGKSAIWEDFIVQAADIIGVSYAADESIVLATAASHSLYKLFLAKYAGVLSGNAGPVAKAVNMANFLPNTSCAKLFFHVDETSFDISPVLMPNLAHRHLVPFDKLDRVELRLLWSSQESSYVERHVTEGVAKLIILANNATPAQYPIFDSIVQIHERNNRRTVIKSVDFSSSGVAAVVNLVCSIVTFLMLQDAVSGVHFVEQ